MTPQVPNRTVFERALPREEMDDTTRALFDAALRVQEHAHAPYSNYHVGCSVLTSSGQIYVGANIENAAYPQGLCAEA
ncbi:MAG: cytidine deaminase, partial [Actinomycetota bacterium]|nr:cytidine deaminase [Actinomycetota bacterium]